MKKNIAKFNVPDVFKKSLADSSRATADEGVALIIDNESLFSKLFELSFTMPYPLCMRAARIIQLCCDKKPEMSGPYADNIVKKIIHVNVGGVKRSYLKILNMHCNLLALENPGILAGLCFNWLMSMKEDTAVLMHCMDILFKMSKREPDLLQELSATLEYRLDSGSKGFKYKAAKILNSIKP